MLHHQETETGCVLIMDHLGTNLFELFYEDPSIFEMEKICQIGIKVLDKLEALHGRGYLHRDIKPDNILMRTKNSKDKIALIDFGYSAPYTTASGEHIKHRTNEESFIGSPGFASLATHERRTLSRKDDLVSLFYVLIYLAEKGLPWDDLPEIYSEKTQLELIR